MLDNLFNVFQSRPMELFALGIDGGGSKTRAALADGAGRLLGAATAGPSNYDNLPGDLCSQNLQAAAHAAFRAAHRAPQPANAAFLGMAGVKAPVDARAVASLAAQAGLAHPSAIHVVNDTETALAGGLAGQPGIVLIAGTGSHCFGRNAAGNSAFCGGWGCLLDDAGSGYALGLQALQTAVRMFDGRAPESPLAPAMLRALGLSDPLAILHRVYVQGMPPADIAALAPLVLDLARQNDPAARAVLQNNAEALAHVVATVATQLFPGAPVPIVLIGGMTTSGPPYQPLIESAITAAVPLAQIHAPRFPPVVGAVIRALESAGVPPGPSVLANLAATLPAVQPAIL